MHRERHTPYALMAVFLDVAIVGISFVIAYYEKRSLPGDLASLSPIQTYGWMFLLYLILVTSALYFFGFYTFGRTQTYTDIVLGTTKAVGTAFALLILILFLVKEHDISRLFIGLFCLNNALLLIFVKFLLRFLDGKMIEHGYNQVNALVIGSGNRAERLIDNLMRNKDMGYRVVGCLDPDTDRIGWEVAGTKVLDTTDHLAETLEINAVDEVFVAMPFDKVRDMHRLIYLCEEVGVRFSLVADFVKPHIAKTVVRNFIDQPVITYTSTPTAVGQLLIKAIIDRVGAAIALVLLLPVFFVIALIIKLTSKGPVFFIQERSGLNGRLFRMLKFRTMVVGADQMLDQLRQQNEMDGPVFKMKHDPRITSIGRFLRHTSLDELPQLINVLQGEMSLVGPRPPIPAEVEKYERWQRRRLSMKPGLTCYWQISGRNDVRFEDWMTLDLKYIDNWSLKLDFVILLKTIPVVLTGRGAH